MTTTYGTVAIRVLAHKIFFAMKAQAERRQAEYDEECREWAEQGYRPHYCIHGTNLWTDYDNICQGCEDSEPLWDDARDWDDAKWRAERTYEQMDERREIVMQVVKADPRNEDFIDRMLDWAVEPLERVKKRFGI